MLLTHKVRLAARKAWLRNNLGRTGGHGPRGAAAFDEFPWIELVLPLGMPFGRSVEPAIKVRKIDDTLVLSGDGMGYYDHMYLIGSDDEVLKIIKRSAGWGDVFKAAASCIAAGKEVRYLFSHQRPGWTWTTPVIYKFPQWEDQAQSCKHFQKLLADQAAGEKTEALRVYQEERQRLGAEAA